MNTPTPNPETPGFAAPAMVAGARLVTWLSADGEVEELSAAAAIAKAGDALPIVCHALATAARLGARSFAAYDILELFAFTRPAQFCLPTPGGLAIALNLAPPGDAADGAMALQGAARALLRELAAGEADKERLGALAMAMARAGWRWGPAVLSALGVPADGELGGAMNAWQRLPEREDSAPPPAPSDHAIGPEAAREQLAALIGQGAESRPQQFDYAAAAAGAFLPRQEAEMPRLVLAEAGTGVGKTLGYIAPASLWARKNGGTVWLSTYTRNLQRQIDGELDRLYPDPKQKRRNVVVRKGRENYLCLLNFEDATKALATSPGGAVALGLIARWVENSRDGDMLGGDFPAWLATLFGGGTSASLTDRRGECIYSACRHYSKCFIERNRRESERAEIVVANHALVMIRAVLEAGSGQLPLRYVFDEGHHVFDAADSAFAAHVAGSEGAELRRWLLGNEGGRGGRGRARGLEARIGDLIGDDDGLAILQNSLRAAATLAGPGWLQRLAEGAPSGPMETFLARVRHVVLARVDNDRSPYGLEVSVLEPEADLLQAASEAAAGFEALRRPLLELGRHLLARLDEAADELDTPSRLRIEAGARSLKRRADMVQAWRAMLLDLGQEAPGLFVDWFAIERQGGRERDVGMHRHWVDPSQPFAEAVLRQAHGVLITSATLRDNPPDAPEDWTAAEVRTGALHLAQPAVRASLASPFDYPGATRILVVRDVNRNQPDQVAAAYRELFLAAEGGGLGLFTAIQRLRAVHQRIAKPLDEAGIPLLAQHVDAMDTGTLVDIFRAEENTCLLGTDAVRDGVDVPGRSLRLIVFDRVPWPRPDILHRARKKSFGAGYDDMIARLRLKQAYGRLLRRADDRGVFVMLDAMLPTRLTTAFPPGVEVQRLGLAEA
ncbi:MAG: ATP-dependent DNA helicase, partial [Alphaproteobacteria bacterium]|nr:ATP-dependent DNA helicase [Alphaproteobacteria bacterium]